MGGVAGVVVAAVLLLASCAPSDRGSESAQGIEVSDAYAAEPVSREVGAVYLTIRNLGTVADTLMGARTPIAGMVHIHRMAGMGMSQMRMTASLEVPAGGLVQLRPGDLHLMLMNLTGMPHAGDTIDLTLVLRHAGDVALRVPVVSYLEVGERAAVGVPDDTR